MVAILVPIVMLVLRPRRTGERDRADCGEDAAQSPASRKPSKPEESSWALSSVVRSGRFLTISIPFALALAAQVGVLTHQLPYLSPILGTVAAGWAVSLTAFAAVTGRTIAGLFVDKLDRRITACGNFLVQIGGRRPRCQPDRADALSRLRPLRVGGRQHDLVAGPDRPPGISQPPLRADRQPRVAINQFTFAFGPSLLGYLRQRTGGYTIPLIACIVIEAVAAFIVILPVLAQSRRKQPLSRRPVHGPR